MSKSSKFQVPSSKGVPPSAEFPIEGSRDVLEHLKRGKIYNLKPGDLIVITVDRKIYSSYLGEKIQAITRRLFPKNRFILTVDGVRIKIIRRKKKR